MADPEHPEPVVAAQAHHVEQADVAIDGTAVFDRKVEALRAYRSQVTVVDSGTGPALEFPHGAVEPITVVETFRHVPEPRAPEPAVSGVVWADYGLPGKVLMYALALVAGGLFGAIGTVAHQDRAAAFPYGVVLALALVAALMVGFRLVFDTRLVALVIGLGVVVVTLLLSQTSSGGSILVPGNAIGYAWVGGSILISAIVLVWPKLPPRVRQGGQARGDRMDQSPQPVSGLPDANGKNRP